MHRVVVSSHMSGFLYGVGMNGWAGSGGLDQLCIVK